MNVWRAAGMLPVAVLGAAIAGTPAAAADNKRLNDGVVAETVAINPALAINGVEIMNQWYNRPDYLAIMSDCANTRMGVWSGNSLDRSVVVAVYGQPA